MENDAFLPVARVGLAARNVIACRRRCLRAPILGLTRATAEDVVVPPPAAELHLFAPAAD